MKTPKPKDLDITSTPKKPVKKGPQVDHDSTTNDPTQPDTETSHKRVHKIGDSIKTSKTK